MFEIVTGSSPFWDRLSNKAPWVTGHGPEEWEACWAGCFAPGANINEQQEKKSFNDNTQSGRTLKELCSVVDHISNPLTIHHFSCRHLPWCPDERYCSRGCNPRPLVGMSFAPLDDVQIQMFWLWNVFAWFDPFKCLCMYKYVCRCM